VQNIDGALLDPLAEAVPQIQLLASSDWCAQCIRYAFVALDIVPRHWVFDPSQVEGFPRLAQANHLVQGQVAVAEMVSTQRYLVPHGLTNGRDDFDRASDAAIGQLSALPGAGRAPALAQLILEPGRLADQAAWRMFKEAGADVELDKRQAQRLTAF